LTGTDSEPWRHQVSELPPIKPIVTEYQLSRFVERIFSIVETCRLQKRNTYDYLVQAIKAKFSGKSAPSLLEP
jgi:hypothetical protein